MSHDLSRLDATAQAELVRKGEASPRELVDAAIGRIEKLNPELNAVITPLFEKARADAAARELPQGPFRGVPFLLKDLGAWSAGDRYCAGMRLLRDLDWREKDDSFLAARYRAAGFVFVGKSNTPEFGSVTTTEPDAFGPSRNPWNPAHSTGGSSGGAGAAVASGMVPAAHANDGGGSIRIPASECGLVGLKPTRGRVSLGPAMGEIWAGLVADHVVTHSVRDSAAILDATAGPMIGDPYYAPPPPRPFAAEVLAKPGRLRIGLRTRTGNPNIVPHPDCVRAANDAAKLLESLGHHVEEACPAALDDLHAFGPFSVLLASWTARDIDAWSARTGKPIGSGDVEIHNWAMAEIGRKIPAAQYVESVTWLHAHARRIQQWWADGFDLLLTPTLAEPPPPLGQFRSTPENPLAGLIRSGPFAVYCSPFNITGQPAISLPLHWNEAGLPIGVQLVAAYAREDVLFRVAAQLEEAQPWTGRSPRVHA
jgi:amidase